VDIIKGIKPEKKLLADIAKTIGYILFAINQILILLRMIFS